MMGRAAYRSGVPLWEITCVDEWKKSVYYVINLWS